MFLIPINACFRIDLEQNFKILFSVLFFCDILINFNTGYFNKGLVVIDRKTIIIHYLKGEFIADLLSGLSYFVDFREYGHYNLMKFLFFLRWGKLEKISSKVQEKFKIGLKIHTSVIDLIDLLCFSFFILNFFACFWYYIAIIYQDEPSYKTWLSVHQLLGEEMLYQYLYSLYWSSVTIMTVGYGDFSAENISEVMFSIFTIFFGCGLFAYFINSVGIIVQEINKDSYMCKLVFFEFFSLKYHKYLD